MGGIRPAGAAAFWETRGKACSAWPPLPRGRSQEKLQAVPGCDRHKALHECLVERRRLGEDRLLGGPTHLRGESLKARRRGHLQHLHGPLIPTLESVLYGARREDERAGRGDPLLLAAGEGDLAVEDVPGLVLVLVDMGRWAETRRAENLHEGEGIVGLRATRLDAHQRVEGPQMLAATGFQRIPINVKGHPVTSMPGGLQKPSSTVARLLDPPPGPVVFTQRVTVSQRGAPITA